MSKPKRNWEWATDQGLTILHREDLFDAMLDDCEEMIKVCGLTYMPSKVLKSVDPTAYRCGVNDYIDSRLTDGDIVALDDETLVYKNELDRVEDDES